MIIIVLRSSSSSSSVHVCVGVTAFFFPFFSSLCVRVPSFHFSAVVASPPPSSSFFLMQTIYDSSNSRHMCLPVCVHERQTRSYAAEVACYAMLWPCYRSMKQKILIYIYTQHAEIDTNKASPPPPPRRSLLHSSHPPHLS